MEPSAPTHASAPPAHSHGHEDYAHVSGHMRMYVGIGFIQAAMTCVTICLSLISFASFRTNILLVLLSASVNAVAVAAYLMHLRQERALIWRVLFFTGAFFTILFFLTLLYWSSPIVGTGHTHH